MANAGVINIGLKASVEPFTKGIATAERSLSTVVGGAAAKGLGILGGGIDKLGGSAKGLIGSISGIGSVAGIAGAALGALGGASIAALTANSLSALDAQGELADRLGVTGGALAAFSHAVQMTGGPTEELPAILGKLSATLGKAASEGGTAGEAFTKLGLDAGKLANVGPIEALKQIGDRIGAISNPALQAAAAVEIFGKKGPELLGTLKAGSAGIAEFEKEAVALGVAVDGVGYASIAAANDQLDRAKAAFAGIGNSFAVALSPYIEAASKAFVDFLTSGGPLIPKLQTGIQYIGTGLGYVVDVANLGRIAFLGVQTAATGFAGLTITGIGLVGKALESLLNLIPGVNATFGSTTLAIGESLTSLAKDQGKALFDAIKTPPSEGIQSFFSGVESAAHSSAAAVTSNATAFGKMGESIDEAGKKVQTMEAKLRESIATFGMNTYQVELYKAAQDGASDADINRIGGLLQQKKAMDEAKSAQEQMAADAKRFVEETRTPLEKMAETQAKLKTLLESGQIDKTTFDRATAKSRDDAGLNTPDKFAEKAGDSRTTGEATKFAGALAAGSIEARSAVLNHQAGRGNDKTAEKTADNTGKTAQGVQSMANEFRRLFVAMTTGADEPAYSI